MACEQADRFSKAYRPIAVAPWRNATSEPWSRVVASILQVRFQRERRNANGFASFLLLSGLHLGLIGNIA
jgi:hypothetical protein